MTTLSEIKSRLEANEGVGRNDVIFLLAKLETARLWLKNLQGVYLDNNEMKDLARLDEFMDSLTAGKE